MKLEDLPQSESPAIIKLGEFLKVFEPLATFNVAELAEKIEALEQSRDEAIERAEAVENERNEWEGKYDNHPAIAKLAAFEDPANWQDGNRWVPVLASTTDDPLLFAQQGF
jgi:hypothetical protein